MKTILISIIISVFTILNISAQKNIENTDWFIKTIEVNKEKTDYYQHLMFKTDGYVQMEGRVFGRWEYDKKAKTITIESRMIKEFSGVWKIVKLTNTELSINNSSVKMFMEKYNEAKLVAENTKSGLIGYWVYANEYNDKTYFKFEKPAKLVSVSISADEGSTSTGSGLWFYNSKDKSFVVTDRYSEIKGKSVITKKTDNEIVLSNRGNEIVLKKVDSNIDNITFISMDDNSELYKELNLIQRDEGKEYFKMKYSESENNTNVEYLKTHKKLTYIKQSVIEKLNILSSNEKIMNIKKEADNISVDRIFGNITASNVERNNFLYPIENVGTFDEFKAFEEQKITVPAGTFICNVFEVTFSNYKALIYMINDKPGIYAKIIITEEEHYNNTASKSVFELSKIE